MEELDEDPNRTEGVNRRAKGEGSVERTVVVCQAERAKVGVRLDWDPC